VTPPKKKTSPEDVPIAQQAILECYRA